MQLASLELRTDQKKEALGTLALARLKGVTFNDQDLRLLAQLYAQNGIPERAAKILAERSDAGQNVQIITEQAIYWQRAKEWDEALQGWKLAARSDGKYHWQVAQILLQQGEYRQALTELDKVKGRQSQVALARTRAFYKLNKLDSAIAQAKSADNLSPSREAKGWIKYLTQLCDLQQKQHAS